MKNFQVVIVALVVAALMPAGAMAKEAAKPKRVLEAPRNTLRCGDAPPAAWIGGSAGASELSAATAPLSSAIHGTDGSVLRAFHVEHGPVAVRIAAVSNNQGDPSLTLLAPDGSELGSNDDAEGGYTLDAQLETTLPGGDYCVGISDTSGDMDLTLQISRDDQPALIETGPLACKATTPKQPLSEGNLDDAIQTAAVTLKTPAKRRSYLAFTLAQPTTLTLRATAAGEDIDPRMALFDATGEALAQNDDADGVNPRLDFPTPLPAGSYCLAVMSAYPSDGQIAVAAQKLDPAAYLRAAYERGQIPPPAGDYPVTALQFQPGKGSVVLLGNAARWFSFTLDRRSVVAIASYGGLSGVDGNLRLFDTAGRPVPDSNGDTSGSSEIAPLILDAGDYMLALTDRDSVGQQGAPLRPVVLTAEKFVSPAP